MPGAFSQLAVPQIARLDFPAQIVAAGPDAEPDLSGNVYWVEELDSMATSGDATDGAGLDVHTDGRIVAAEWLDGSDHSLAVGQRVHVFPLTDRAAAPKARWYFSLRGGQEVTYNLTAYIHREDLGYSVNGKASLLWVNGVNRAEVHALFKFPAPLTLAQCEAARWRLNCVLDIIADSGTTAELVGIGIAWCSDDFDAAEVWPGPDSDFAGRCGWDYVQHRVVIGAGTPYHADFGVCDQSANDVPIYGAKVYWLTDWLTYPAGTLTSRIGVSSTPVLYRVSL